MLKILIVDDEHLARETVKMLLGNRADVLQIYEAQDANQALALANQLRPDIVVLDIEMPGMSGVELSKQLPNESVVIFATAFNQYVVEISELNAVDYILKPFDDDTFYVAFERAKVRLTKGHSESSVSIHETI